MNYESDGAIIVASNDKQLKNSSVNITFIMHVQNLNYSNILSNCKYFSMYTCNLKLIYIYKS